MLNEPLEEMMGKLLEVNPSEAGKVEHGKQEKKRKKKGRERKMEAGNNVGTEDDNERKRKKVKSIEDVSGGPANIETTDLSEKRRPDKKPKKNVKFSDHVEVFPSSNGQEGLIQGKRFSQEEDKMVKNAVLRYIKNHRLGKKKEVLPKILQCKSHPELKGCWKEIASALPWRPRESIYYRAHVIFERSEKRSWTPEDKEFIRRFHEEHGSNWRVMADALKKHRFQVKDAWRRMRLPNRKKGAWAQEEYQTLFDLVNLDLQMRALEEKKSKHGMLRDNIGWEAICEKLSTRINSSCCLKWYGQLTSRMVIEGKWADTDDYRLLKALFKLDACCMEDVDWDGLLEHREGDVCRKRWEQMIRYIGHYKNKSFSEQVEILANRYCPDLIQAREAWDAKLPVDLVPPTEL